jgi:hypothetical protein
MKISPFIRYLNRTNDDINKNLILSIEGLCNYLLWIKLNPKVSWGLKGVLFLFLKMLLLFTYAPTAFSTPLNKFSIDFIQVI